MNPALMSISILLIELLIGSGTANAKCVPSCSPFDPGCHSCFPPQIQREASGLYNITARAQTKADLGIIADKLKKISETPDHDSQIAPAQAK